MARKSLQVLFVSISTILLAEGCTLPLCDEGDKFCSVEVRNTSDCLSVCKSEICPEECLCQEEDSDCTTVVVTDPNQSCTMMVCENDTWQKEKYCEFGFNGMNCNPNCQNGAVLCDSTAEDPNKCMLRRCIDEQWQEIRVCQHGFDGEGCKLFCEPNTYKCDKTDETSEQCMLKKCVNDEWTDVRVCLHGFDGESCKQFCEPNTYICDKTDESSEQCMLKKCVNDEWTDVKVCPHGYDGEACKLLCEPNSYKCDKIDETSEQCMLKKCVDDEWTDVRVCLHGYDGEACKLLCEPNSYKCDRVDETSEQCMLKKCLDDEWTDVRVCQHGYDGEACKLLCEPNSLKCDKISEESAQCMLKKCLDDEWQDVRVCPHGFNGETCNLLCEPNAYKCDEIDGTSKQCMLKKCIDDQWQNVRTCKFGFDDDMEHCIDPCDICKLDDSREQCPSTIYDKRSHTMYQCSQETGWNIGVCSNDFSEDSSLSIIEDIDINRFMDESLNLSDELQTSNLVYGQCGECSEDNSPTFCSGDKKYIYHCMNGKYSIDTGTNETCTFNVICTDAYGEILVNTESNRYHCGACNYVCGLTQSCIDGKCVSTITKEDCVNHYARVQLGSRWVQAYCIETVDELKNIGTVDTYENAFILVDDIDITESWNPLDRFEQGIFLGNGKTIKIHGLTTNAESMGLFTEIANSYFDELSIDYTPANTNTIQANYLGLLAGKANNSTVKNIKLKGDIRLGVAIAAGGLFGLAQNNVSVSGVTYGINIISANNKEAGTNDDTSTGIGGLIGVAENISKISYIVPFSPSNLNFSISGSYNVGGLIGLIRHTSDVAHQIVLSNEDVEDNVRISFDLSGNFNVGGLVGRVITTQNTLLNTRIEHFNLNEVKLKINKSLEVNELGNQNLGGILGSAYYINNGIESSSTEVTIISDVQLNKTTFERAQAILVNDIGGVVGYAENATLQNVRIDEFYANDGTKSKSMNKIGGIVGEGVGTKLYECNVKSFYFNALNSLRIGGLAGCLTNTSVTMSKVGTEDNINSVIIDTSGNTGEGAGGFVGYASDSTFYMNMVYGTTISALGKCGGLIGIADNVVIDHTEVFNTTISGKVGVGGGLIGQSKHNVTATNVSVISQSLSGSYNVGGLIACVTGNGKASLSHCKTISMMKNASRLSGFVGGPCVSTASNSLVFYIDNSIAESNIILRKGSLNEDAVGFLHSMGNDSKISFSSAYTYIHPQDEAKVQSKNISGFVNGLESGSKAFATTALSNIGVAPYGSSPKNLIFPVRSWGDGNSSTIATNIQNDQMENKIIYNTALSYIHCPYCESESNNCLCSNIDDIIKTDEIYYDKDYQCLNGCGNLMFSNGPICHNNVDGYLSHDTTYSAASFSPTAYINDEPDWHTADRAEFRCICRTETPTDDPENPISVTEEEYFTLEPMDDSSCTCDPMWFELTCDVERFKSAIGCEENQCDGLINKLKRQKPAPEGKFLHDVPISPVTNPDVVCDQGEFVTIENRCYEVLKPSFCDMPNG